MFTGIIESKGEIISIANKTNSREFTVSLDNMFDDVNIGDSIAVNGVCLTATGISSNQINFDVISETLEKSNLGDLITGSEVNLERALSLSSRINGHILQGHVEAVGVIVDYKKNNKEVVMSVGIYPGLLIYCIPKGSIAFDGISLTIAKISDNIIDVALIPHTLEHTNLKDKKIGDSVNIETDIIGKYICQFISGNDNYEDVGSALIKTLNNLGLS
tara:strand:+ start:934 stop:1584 length:651 start_codon:yes stop_codon:yes gene_type:complete